MECSEVRIKSDEYIKNRLEDEAAGRIALHIDNCRRCADELNMLRELNEMLSVEKIVYPSDGFTLGIMKRIQSESMGKKPLIFNRAPIKIGRAHV